MVGLSFHDFCLLTPVELEEVFRAWREHHERGSRDSWERMRLHAVMTMQPHCKKRLNARSLLPFPWEKREAGPAESAAVSREEQRERFLRRAGLSADSGGSTSGGC